MKDCVFHPVPSIRFLTTAVVFITSLGTTSVQAGSSMFSSGASLSEPLKAWSQLFEIASRAALGMTPALYRIFQTTEPSPLRPDPDRPRPPGRMSAVNVNVNVDVSASLHDSRTVTWYWPGKAGLKLCATQSFQLFQIQDDHDHLLLISHPELSDTGGCYTLTSPDEAGQASVYLNLDNLGAIDWQRSALGKGEQWLPLAGIEPQLVMMKDARFDLASFSPGLWLKPQQESGVLLYLDSALPQETTTGPGSGIIQYGAGQSKSSESTTSESSSDSSHTGTSQSPESGAARGAVGGIGGGVGGSRDEDDLNKKRQSFGSPVNEEPEGLVDMIVNLTQGQKQMFKSYCQAHYAQELSDELLSDSVALKEHLDSVGYNTRSDYRALVNRIKLGDSEPTSLTPNQLRFVRFIEWVGSFVPGTGNSRGGR